MHLRFGRVYVGSKKVPRVLGGLGVNILTTPRGVMTGSAARKEGVGGEILGLGDFARKAIAFTDPENGVAVNTADLAFGPATEAWPKFINWSIWDAATAGNCLFTKPFAAPLEFVDTGGSIEFPAGTVKISVG